MTLVDDGRPNGAQYGNSCKQNGDTITHGRDFTHFEEYLQTWGLVDKVRLFNHCIKFTLWFIA